MSRSPRPVALLGALLAALGALVFVAVMISCVVALAIWPGQVKLVSFLFCSDAQPDPFVVADVYNPRPGETVTNFSLYCMGPRGDATDHGFFWPFAAVTALNGLAVIVLATSIVAVRRMKRRSATNDATNNGDRVEGPESPASSRATSANATVPTTARRGGRPTAPPGSTSGPFVD